jgi:hypothetical protein
VSDQCYSCGKELGIAARRPLHPVIASFWVCGVGKHEQHFTVCEGCGRKALVDHAKNPWPEETK